MVTRYSGVVRTAVVAATALFASLPATAAAQRIIGSPDMQPVNSLPNPYRTIEGWAKLGEGRNWGSTSAVAIDRDGTSVWVAERCSTNTRGCYVNNTLDPVLKFDANGNLVTSFGKGMIVWPHGIHVDPQGNVWVVDGQRNVAAARAGGAGAAADAGAAAGGRGGAAAGGGGGAAAGRGGAAAGGGGAAAGGRGGAAPATPAADTPTEIYGMQVFKFSPTGQLLMTLGQKGGSAEEGQYFQEPNAVAVAPNGDIFVSEGHGNASRARIYVFNSNGQLLRQFGSTGEGPGEFRQPHDLAFDSQGRLFVADRGNNRIQIFTQQGQLLEIWYQFSRNSGIYIDQNDVLYAADSESGSVNPAHGSWLRGIRIGNARTGEVQYLIPDPNPDCSGTCTAEGVAADRNGVIYGAEVGPSPGRLQRYVRQ